MDKETLSQYGWIVICILVLSVMIALATPFGDYIATAVENTTQGLFDVQQKAMGVVGLVVDDQKFEENGGGGTPETPTECPVKFGMPYSITEDITTLSIILYEDGSADILWYDDGELIGSDSLPAGTLGYDGLDIISLDETLGDTGVVATITADGTKIDLEGLILTLTLPCPHTSTIIKDIEATCVEDGMKDAEVCLDCGAIVAVGETVSALEHNYDENGYCTVCGADKYTTLCANRGDKDLLGFTGAENEEWIIPSICYDEANDIWYRVVGINEMFFNDSENLVSVTIPDSVTFISPAAFEDCTNLVSVNVDKNNPNYCSVDGVIYSKDMTTLIHCPAGKKVSSFVVPDSVTSIGYGAFKNHTSLTNIVLPNNLTSIDSYAFYGCTSLTSIEIPNGVTVIDDGAFMGCTSLKSINIPDSVTRLGRLTFKLCTNLTAVTFGENSQLTYVGYQTFYGCRSLTNLTIPAGVIDIGDNYNRGTFSACTSLVAINVDKNNTNYCSVDGVLYTKNMTTLICYPAGKNDTSFVVPDGVVKILRFAFSDTVLTSITIPSSVTTIGNNAFESCTSLTNVIIPEGVTKIGDQAFQGCSKLTSITIPSSVTYIGEGAFNGCSKLTSATFTNTEGWWYADSWAATSGTELSSFDLVDTNIAAKYLSSTYLYYYWFHTDTQK